MIYKSTIPGITRAERTRFDEAMEWFKMSVPEGHVLRFRGVPVNEIVWTERDKIRVVLEYDKERAQIVQRNGHAIVFAPPMTLATDSPIA